MSHSNAVNDVNWTGMLNLMNISLNTLTNQLCLANTAIREKEDELKTLQMKYDKDVAELRNKVIKLEDKLKEYEHTTDTFTLFKFEDISKPQSYASKFFKKACHEIIDKHNLNNGTSREERLESKRLRDEAAREVLNICGFKDINDTMLKKTRTRLTSVMADPKYYAAKKRKILNEHSSSVTVSNIENPVSASTPVRTLSLNNPDVSVPVSCSVTNDNDFCDTVMLPENNVLFLLMVLIQNFQIETRTSLLAIL